MKKFLLTILVIFLAYYAASITAPSSENKELSDFGKLPFFYKLYCLFSGSTDTTNANSLNERALNYESGQNYEMAIKDFRKVIELDSSFNSAYFDLSRNYLKSGDTSMAVSTLHSYLKNALYPDKVCAELANIYLNKGNKDSCIYFYKKALEINKENDNIYYALAVLYYKDTLYDPALENINQAIQQNESEPDYRNLRRQIYLKQKKQEQASEEYNYISNNYPEYFGKYEENAKAAYEKNDFQAAVEYYKLALLIKPNDRSLLESKAWAYRQLNKFDSSLLDYKLVCELYPDYLSYFNCAYILDIMNLMTESISFYSKSIEMKDDYYLSYNNRGYEYFRLKKYKEAEKDYTRSIDLEPEYYLNNYNRAILYARLNKDEKAVTDYLNALKYENSANIHYDLALSYQKLKKNEEAINSFNEYLKFSDKSDTIRINYATRRIEELGN